MDDTSRYIREGKTRVGGFQALLLKEDLEQAGELNGGEREMLEKTGA